MSLPFDLLRPLEAAQAFSRARLHASWQRTLARDPRPGPDGLTPAQFAAQASTRLEQLHLQLLSGEYQAVPAYRAWIPKESGGERAVVALGLTDRIVEGALLDALRPVIEPRLHAAAFAYRQGLGALRATEELLRRRDEGLQWVVRGDVRDCFDMVPHGPLMESLVPLLSLDVQRTVYSLLTRVVMDKGRATQTQRGVAQGSLLAPIFANWYLRPFDEEVTQAGGALVRYADDFVVASTDALSAGQLLMVSGTALERLGMSLNPRKTQVLSFGQGFDFLGFQFRSQSVRVSPARMEVFQREVGTLLAAQPPSPAALQAVNDLVRGWRAYFALGEVAQDFQYLDNWMTQQFPHLRPQLALLCPESKPAALSSRSLGGYAIRPRSNVKVKVPAVKPATQETKPQPVTQPAAHQVSSPPKTAPGPTKVASKQAAQMQQMAYALALAWATGLAEMWAYNDLPERHATALLASRYSERLTPDTSLPKWIQELETGLRATYRQYGPSAEHLRRSGIGALEQQVEQLLRPLTGLEQDDKKLLATGVARLYALPLLDTPLPELLEQPRPVMRVLQEFLSQPLAPGYPLTWQGALQREVNTISHSLKSGQHYQPRGWQ